MRNGQRHASHRTHWIIDASIYIYVYFILSMIIVQHIYNTKTLKVCDDVVYAADDFWVSSSTIRLWPQLLQHCSIHILYGFRVTRILIIVYIYTVYTRSCTYCYKPACSSGSGFTPRSFCRDGVRVRTWYYNTIYGYVIYASYPLSLSMRFLFFPIARANCT